MFIILKNIYIKLFLGLIIYILLNIKIQYIKKLLFHLCQHNYYKIKNIDPTELLDGKIYLTCGFCGNNKTVEIPKLSEKNYIIEIIKANCEHGNGKRYISKEDNSIVYEITDNIRHNHTIYGSKCSVCNKNIGEFDFHRLSNLYCYGYPRLYRLSEYWNNTWLLGGDNGTILCYRSQDQGLTWSEASKISNFNEYFCSNVDFFELPNHYIICSYRAIGNSASKDENILYNRKIFSSISKDGGKTWEELGLIVDNFILANRFGKTKKEAIQAVKNEKNIGFFEPFVQYFNNKITVIYADDFTPMLLLLTGSVKESRREQSIYSHTFDIKTSKWSKKRKLIMNGYIKKSPIKSGLNKKISRDGMPVTDVLKDGTYVMVFEGTYRNKDYKNYTGGELNLYHPFEIVISHSKDGDNWSNPIEIYHGYNNGSKYSAPYICVTKSDQLIISFQTDENSVNSGYIGDLYSIMKVLISKPGIPIEKINRDSFFAVTNNNKSPIGSSGLWNGMMLVGNILYTCSSGHPILYSELPLYDDPNKYNDMLSKKYYKICGDAEFIGNKIISKGKSNIIVYKNFKFNSDVNIYSNIMPNIIGDCGFIFGFSDYNLKLDNYFLFIINQQGLVSFKRKTKNNFQNIFPDSECILQNYNKENVYKMNLKYNYSTSEIIAFINDIEIFKLVDKIFLQKGVGFISTDKGTIFTQILLE